MEPLEQRTLLSVSVLTDALEYAPEQPVAITASGFTPGETVEFQVSRIDGAPIAEATWYEPWQITDGSQFIPDGVTDPDDATDYDLDGRQVIGFDFNGNGVVDDLAPAKSLPGGFNLDALGPGVFTITVTANDRDGDRLNDEETASEFVTVTLTNADPVARPGLDQIVNEGDTVIFDGRDSSDADGDALEYSWNFNDPSDPTPGVGPTPSHVYSASGTYQVDLTVDDNYDGVDTASPSLTVRVENVAPEIVSVVNNGPVASGDPVTVTISATDAGGDTLSYEFDFDGDGVYEVSGATPQATYVFPADGTYPVSVRVSDGEPGGEAVGFTVVQMGSPAAGLLDEASVTDVGAEFTLSGAAASGITLDGAGVLLSGATYRYSLTGSFAEGPVQVDFLAGSFQDDAAVTNLARTEFFTVTALPTAPPTASLEDPLDGGAIQAIDLNARGYIDVTFTDAGGTGLDTASITDAGAEFGLGQAAAAGVTIDGAGALVGANKNGLFDFLDLNHDGVQDPGEPSEIRTATALDGIFGLFGSALEVFDLNQNGLIDLNEGQMVVTGGTVNATGLPLATTLIGPAGSFAVSPLSTLMAGLINQHGFTLEGAQQRVLEAFQLPPVDLTRFDAIAETVDGHADGPAIYAASTKLQDTIAQAASLLAGIPDAPPTTLLTDLVVADVAAKIVHPDSALDLSHPLLVETVIDGVLARTGLGLDAAGPSDVLAGGLHFQGGNLSDDTLTIMDGWATTVVHAITGLDSGAFEIDGAMISYAGVESAADDFAPAINGLPLTSPEGTAIDLSNSIADPDWADAFSYEWTVTRDGVTYAGGDQTNFQFTPGDNGPYVVSLTISAEERGTATTTQTVTVTNVAPSIQPGSLTLSDVVINEDGSVTVTGSFTDAGTEDTHSVMIDWGLGEDSSAAVVTQGAGSGTFTATHQYLGDNLTATSSNSYTITATVTDDDGGAGTATVTLTVRNLVDLSGRVFDDRGNDGVFDSEDGDAGIGGVKVDLFDQTTGAWIDTQTTAADGAYTFDVNLHAGTYKIVEYVDELADLGLLDGRETAGNLFGTVDNSQNSNEITGISVGAPGTTADAVDYLFAEIEPSDLFGTVWRDFNHDGEINFGEAGLP